MSTYKATFTAMAEVVIEFELEAPNQQDGLVLAHDHIRHAQPGQARIVRLDLDKALNTAFERVSGTAASVPPSPLELAGKFKVQFYLEGAPTDRPVVETDIGVFEAAKTLAESILCEDSAYGCSRVLDEMGMMVLKAQAPRGGYEVEGYGTDATAPLVRYSWQESAAIAKQTMLQLLARKDIQFVRIIDFNDRAKGPVLWKEIR